jgi:hypothetical protein
MERKILSVEKVNIAGQSQVGWAWAALSKCVDQVRSPDLLLKDREGKPPFRLGFRYTLP